ncbi:MAG: hypothetical protein JHD28_00490 [Bacteroidia bacterium]|nr:hypothetical protein [Bacteroidia bacterium]
MRVIVIFQVLLIATTINTFGQENPYKLPSNKYIGIQTRLIDYIPVELSFVNIKAKKLSWQAKVGFVYAPINITNNYVLSNTSNTILTNYNFSKEQYLKAFYLKSGILFYKEYDKFGYKYFALNGVYSFAWNTFEITTRDAIYGKIINTLKEESKNVGIELEWQRISKKGFNLGLLLGYKINQTAPFQNQIQNIEKASTYTPGMGFGIPIYFNIQVGYHFKFKKK